MIEVAVLIKRRFELIRRGDEINQRNLVHGRGDVLSKVSAAIGPGRTIACVHVHVRQGPIHVEAGFWIRALPESDHGYE